MNSLGMISPDSLENWPLFTYLQSEYNLLPKGFTALGRFILFGGYLEKCHD